MKNFMLTLACVLSLSKFAFADIVDPVGQDAWKSIVVTVVQLDQRALADVPDSKFYISMKFDDKDASVWTSAVTVGKNAVTKLTVPKANNGAYMIRYHASTGSKYYNNSVSFIVAEGQVSEGVKNIEIRLKRVDVDNMVVTRQDGTKYTAPQGSARVSTRDYALDFKTGFGIDVPVGVKYKASVSANTEDGLDSYESILDFTNL